MDGKNQSLENLDIYYNSTLVYNYVDDDFMNELYFRWDFMNWFYLFFEN
jgi:hypothetical protein